MTLRTRLVLLISGILLLLGLGGWWGVDRLTSELADELGEVAASVGRSMVAVFSTSDSVHVEPPAELLAQMPEEVRERLRRLEGEAESKVHTWTWSSDAAPEGEEGIETRHVVRIERRAELTPAPEGDSAAGPPAVVVLDRDSGPERVLDVVVQRGAQEPLELGVLDGSHVVRRIPIPSAGVEAAVERFSRRLLIGLLVLLALTLLVVVVVVHRATAPLARLAAVAQQVGAGELGERVGPVAGAGREVAAAIEAFDQMSVRLAELDAEARQLRQREQLGELGEVARAVAHSLRNPLNALGLSVDRLARGVDAEQAGELAQSARQQIRRLDASIRSILALAADREAEPGPVELGRLCRDVALEAAQDAAGRVEVRVEVEQAPRLERVVAAELRAIVQALVVNAVEASPDGAEVVVKAGEGPEGETVVSVEDRGAGIDPSVRDRLFSPHVTTKATGSGMGLFIAQRLAVTRYDGRVELHDREGGGTVAEVHLRDGRRG